LLNLSDEAIEEIADGIASRMKNKWRIKDGWERGTAGHEKFWNDYIKRIDPHEKQYKETIRGLLQKQANQVFENIREYPNTPIMWQFNRVESYKELADAESKFTTRLYKQEGQKAIDLALELARKQRGYKATPSAGISFDVMNPLVIEQLLKQNRRFPGGLIGTTESEIRAAIAAGIKEGETIAQIANRVKQKLSPSHIANRAEMIARSEAIYAANAGAELGYIQSGVVEGKQWLIAWDERTCEACEDMDGMTAPVGSPMWEKEGRTILDIQTDYGLNFDYTEGEMPFPPLHPRCRCTIIPILKQIEQGFTPAGNHEEAREFAMREFGISDPERISYGALDMDKVNSINKGLYDVKQKYPKFHLDELISSRNDANPSKALFTSDWWKAGEGQPVNLKIWINENMIIDKYKTLADFNKMCADANKVKWFIGSNMEEVMIHEAGHILSYAGKTSKEIFAMEDAIVGLNKYGISKYGKYNGIEALAEGFVAHEKGWGLIPKTLREALKIHLGVI